MPYGPEFFEEKIDKNDSCLSLGGSCGSFLDLKICDNSKISDGRTTVNCPEIKDLSSNEYPLYIRINVSGNKLNQYFEPFLKRQIKYFINGIKGVVFSQDKEYFTMKINKDTLETGITFDQVGFIINSMLKNAYKGIIEKTEIIFSSEISSIEKAAQQKYIIDKNNVISEITDESVDIFYSCNICQCYVPDHICIIKPEKTGLCGVYTWNDARLLSKIDCYGSFKPVEKGRAINNFSGEWEGVNAELQKQTYGHIEKFRSYGILEFPETSCRCAECIISVIPEANGFIIVNREYEGLTPNGFSFSSLLDIAGRGKQTPGFMGISKDYIFSRKFNRAEGGLSRIVWMPSSLKATLTDKLNKRLREEGLLNLFIPDENIAPSIEALAETLEKIKHPVISMKNILEDL